MKAFFYSTAIAAAMTLSMPMIASAASHAPNAASGGVSSQLSFQDLDKNNDGKISKSEAKGDSALHKVWKSVDSNKDGSIDQSEFSAFEQGHAPSDMAPGSAGASGGTSGGGMENSNSGGSSDTGGKM